MTGLAATERSEIVHLMRRLGPDAPTLCGDWTTHDLAAHLVARERRPLAAAGILIRQLGDLTERARGRYLNMDYAKLMTLLEEPSPWSPSAVSQIDETLNAVEFFVHHEDVRRARPDWRPRLLSRVTEEELWGRLSLARLLLRKTRMTVKLVCPGFGQRTLGPTPIAATVSGPPSEVLMFCFGRQSESTAETSGPAATRLRDAKLGI